MTASIKPIFQSSFIQSWYAKDWHQERWEQELSMLKNIGIREIILASIADTKSKYAVYFSELPNFTHGSSDMVFTALSAANKLGMKVRVGLGFSDDWWTKFSDKSWLNREVLVNKAIIREVASKYGIYASFSGWYIPYEFSQFIIFTKKQQLNINSFFKDITSEIKHALPKDTMIAPYYYGILRCITPLRYWSIIVENTLKDTGIDIVALQDSIGARFSYMKQLPKIYYYTRKACDAIGIKFYVDVETFTHSFSGFISAPQDRIEKQLSIANDYTNHLVAFSIDHYQNKLEQNQAEFYNDYYDYYISKNNE